MGNGASGGSKIVAQPGAMSRKGKTLKSTTICHDLRRIIQTILKTKPET